MKNLITIIILALTTSAMAQNWQPINPDYIYYYKSESSEYIDNSIFVDSIKEESGKTIYYLNTKFSFCDTCEIIVCPEYENWDESYYLSTYSNIFLKEMYIEDNQTIFSSEGYQFVLLNKALINETWIFDTINNITATVTNMSYQEVFPTVSDSLKIIELSSNHQIIHSKSFGIIQFIDLYDSNEIYNLKGIESENTIYGKKVNHFMDYFNFEIGDIFCRDYYVEMTKSTKPPQDYGGFEKVKILNKTVLSDKIQYGIFKQSFDWDGNGDVNYNSGEYDTITYNDDNNHYHSRFCNTLPGMISTKYRTEKASYTFDIGFNDIALTNGGKWYGQCSLYENVFYYSVFNATVRYIAGLGRVYYHDNVPQTSSTYKLQGYIRNGDTTGYIYHDSLFSPTSTNEITINNRIQIYPIPATNAIRIKIPLLANDCIIEITDLTGKAHINKEIRQSDEITLDISYLRKGVYLLKLQTEGKTYFRKIIKS